MDAARFLMTLPTLAPKVSGWNNWLPNKVFTGGVADLTSVVPFREWLRLVLLTLVCIDSARFALVKIMTTKITWEHKHFKPIGKLNKGILILPWLVYPCESLDWKWKPKLNMGEVYMYEIYEGNPIST